MRRIIDFKVTPPARSFLNLHLFRQPERIRRISSRLGVEVPPSAQAADINGLIKEMDEAGVDIGVVSARARTPPGGVARSQAERERYGSIPTSDVLDLIAEHRGRFIALAAIGPTFDETSATEVASAVEQRDAGVRGLVIDPGYGAELTFCDDRRIFPLYEACQAAGLPIFMTLSGNVGPSVEYSHPRHVDAVATSFSELQIVVGHGCWPWVHEILGVAYRHRNVYVCPDLYLRNFPGMQDYVMAANGWLQDQFIFGSSYPFVSHRDAVDHFQSIGLKESSLEKAYWTNPARLLGL